MKKKNKPKIWIAATVFMALIGIVGVSASGPTYVSGIISSNTTWTAADSPYIVTGNILVKEGVTLTIEPEVVVKFNSDKMLQVDGELIARGTETERILFTSNQPSPSAGDWGGIVFTNSSIDVSYDGAGNYLSGSIMQYCTIEYGGVSSTPGLKMVSSSPFIDHCHIYSNAYRGIYLDNSSSRITNSFITNNSGGAIYISSSSANASSNIISNNSVSSEGGGIYIFGGLVALRGNTITDNYARLDGGGIYASNAIVTIVENIISNNSVSRIHTHTSYDGAYIFGGGIYIEGDSANISDNTISGNSLKAKASEYYVPTAYASGGGIYIEGDSANISNNTISGNSLVAEAPAGAYANAYTAGGGIYIEGDSTNIKGNTITGNSLIAEATSWWWDTYARGGGIYINGDSANISNNTINSNSLKAKATSAYSSHVDAHALGGGVYIISDNLAFISGNTISLNSLNSEAVGGGVVSAYGGGVYSYTSGNSVHINSNIVSGNAITDSLASGKGGGIYASGTRSISNNTLSGNSASSIGGGIYASNTESISENIITNNLASEGGGIYAYDVDIINYNNILFNSISQGNGNKAGGIYISGQPDINYNNIYDNPPYDIYNSNLYGSPDVNATNNWWGTTNEAEIQEHIYDWVDDASLGIVNYIPYLTAPITPENKPPVASFTYSPKNPIVNQTITFNASDSTDSDGFITNYEWNFGDGNITNTTEKIITHSYTIAGNYCVTLTVTDNDGLTNSTKEIVKISEPLTLGKGIWIWKLSEAEGGNITAIIERCENVGIEWIAIKCGDGGYFWSQCKLSTIEQFQNAGIKVFGWQYVYGDAPIGEANISNQILDLGVDGFIIDAETEYEGKPDNATTYLEKIREEHSDSFIAYTTFPIIDYHTDFPYLEFGKYCDAVMPQDYWKEIGVTPQYMVEWMEEQWDKWHTIWEAGGYGDSIKPIIPLGQGWDVSGSEITIFCNLIYDHGYGGISLWRYGTMTEENWEAYAKCFVPPAAVFDTGRPENPYPSIFGMHTGTIKPNQMITVSKLYTYPCAGTGGHSEYVKFENTSWSITANWDGYKGDWHNITFDEPFILCAGFTYNYTIKTGSYPQIHHTDNLSTSAGFITCSEFVDANGKRYIDWIPAIKLE